MINTRSVQVSLTVVAEIKPPKNGRQSLMIDNDSGASIRYDFGSAPTDFTGLVLEAGGNASYGEGDRVLPKTQNVYIRGTTAAVQNITVTETAHDKNVTPFKRFIRDLLDL